MQGAVLASQLGSDLEAEVARELEFGPAASLEQVLLDHALALCPVPQVRLTSTTQPTVLRPSMSWSILKIREVLNKESFFLLRATKQQAQFECTSDISEK